MKLSVSTSKDSIADSTGSSYISKSGIYDVTTKFASMAVSAGGAESVNFNLDYNGNDQTIYGPYVTDRAGNDLEIGLRLINQLGVIAGLRDGDALSLGTATHVVGKDKTPTEFTVIENFDDLKCKMRLQEEYSRNPKTGEIKKSMVLKSVFDEDGASAEEIIKFETTKVDERGKRLALETERYASNVSYVDSSKGAGDAPTPEEVEAWKASKATGKAAPAAPAPKPTVSKTAAVFKKA